MAKCTKDKPTSKVYLMLSHLPEESDLTVEIASENYDDLDKVVRNLDLYVSGYQDDFDLTKGYLDERKEFYLDGADEMILVAAIDTVIPEDREMYLVAGIGDEWCWEASILGLYSNLETAWQALAEKLELYDDDYYSYEELKSDFCENSMCDNNYIYWSWIKINIEGKK